MNFYTVWQFTSPSSNEVSIVAKVAEYDDMRYDKGEYQRIMWRGMAASKEDALRLYRKSVS